MQFNEKLQQLRKQRSLTQEELANAIYVSRTAVSKWESGRGYPNIDSLKAIGKFFGVTIDDLLSDGELRAITREEHAPAHTLRGRIFDLLDLCAVLLLIAPLFADRSGEAVRAVNLFGLNASWLKIAGLAAVIGMPVLGLCALMLNRQEKKHLRRLSLLLNALAALLLIAGSQPYAAVFLCALLAVKVFLIAKPR